MRAPYVRIIGTTGAPPTIEEVAAAVEAVVDYCWADELDDYEEQARELGAEEAYEGHVFRHLETLQVWLNTRGSDSTYTYTYAEAAAKLGITEVALKRLILSGEGEDELHVHSFDHLYADEVDALVTKPVQT